MIVIWNHQIMPRTLDCQARTESLFQIFLFLYKDQMIAFNLVFSEFAKTEPDLLKCWIRSFTNSDMFDQLFAVTLHLMRLLTKWAIRSHTVYVYDTFLSTHTAPITSIMITTFISSPQGYHIAIFQSGFLSSWIAGELQEILLWNSLHQQFSTS